MIRPNFVDRVLDLCRQRNFSPEIAQIVGDAVTAVALVAGGFGITVVPESVLSVKPEGVVYLPFNDEPAATIDLSCMFRRGDTSAVLHAFLKAIEIFRERRAVVSEVSSQAARSIHLHS